MHIVVGINIMKVYWNIINLYELRFGIYMSQYSKQFAYLDTPNLYQFFCEICGCANDVQFYVK